MIDEMSTMDAFLALKDIPDEDVEGMLKCNSRKLREAHMYSIHASNNELDEAKAALDAEDTDDTELEVIDINANALADLKPNSEYIGDAILQCVACHAKIVMPLAQVKLADQSNDADEPTINDLCNTETACPICHGSGKGFIFCNQVGKVEENPPKESEETAKETPEENGDEASIENDENNLDEVKFDNDETPSIDNAEEVETSTEEPEEEPEIAAFSDSNEEDDGMQVDQEDDSDDFEVEPLNLDDEDEDKNESLNEDLELDDQAEKAWMMNKTLEYLLNDETDYYSSWLQVWPDKCSEEDCQDYFGAGNESAFNDLAETFDTLYTQHHADGLDNAPDDVIEFAHSCDQRLGLTPIGNQEAKKPIVREAFGYNSVEDFLGLIQDAEDINTIVITDLDGKTIKEGSYEDFAECDLLDKEFQGFNGADSIVTFNIDSEEPNGTRLNDILKFFDDPKTKKVSIVENDEVVLDGTADEALEQYGEAGLLSIQVPERLVIKANISAEDSDDADDAFTDELELVDTKDVEESLFEAICRRNGLKAYRESYKGSEEYFLREDLNNREELDRVYAEYVAGDRKLEEAFKQYFNYLDVVDEAAINLYGERIREKLISKSSSKQLNDGAEQIDKALATAGVKADVAASNTNADESILIACPDEETRHKAHPVIDKVLKDKAWEAGINKDVDDGDIRGIQIGQIKQSSVIGEKNESIRSFKNRKSLSEAIVKLKNNSTPYHVRKSLTEGYRYDLITEAAGSEDAVANFKKYLQSAEAKEVHMTDTLPDNITEEVVQESAYDKLVAYKNRLENDLDANNEDVNEDLDEKPMKESAYDKLLAVKARLENETEEVTEDLEEELPVAIEEPVDVSVEEPVETDCVKTTATAVMAAYQNANKWLDSVKETIYTKLNCPFFSSFVHTLAHTMPERFDKFGDILHTINMEIPYPATQELATYPTDIINSFDVIFNTLDAIKAALNAFIKCTDENNHGMACAAEELLNDIEEEYPMLYRLQAKAKECGEDTVTFDKFVAQYNEHKDDLLESLTEAKKDERIDRVLDRLDKIEAHANLVQNEIDSVESYDDAIKDFEESDLENKDEIISRLHHLKGERLKDIDDLEDVSSLLPDMSELSDEPEVSEKPADEPVVEEPPLDVAVDELAVESLDEDLGEHYYVLHSINDDTYVTEDDVFTDNIDDAAKFNTEDDAIDTAIALAGDIDWQQIFEVVDATPDSEEFDAEDFDNQVNSYFDEAFDDTVVYHTVSGKVNEANVITLTGEVMMNENVSPIVFTLTPSNTLTEDINGKQHYDVTNNLSDEVFELEI